MQIENKQIGMSEVWENWRMFWSEIVLDIEKSNSSEEKIEQEEKNKLKCK